MAPVGELTKTERDVEWRISDMPMSGEIDEFYTSAEFYFMGVFLCLKIYPYGMTKYSSNHVGLFIMRRDTNPPISITYTLKMNNLDFNHTDTYVFSKKDDEYGTPRFMMIDDFYNHRINLNSYSSFTIKCCLKHPDDNMDTSKQTEVHHYSNNCVDASSQTESHVCIDKLLEEFKDLLLSGRNSDITLRVKDKEFIAHKNILASRSPIFLAMMEHKMKETASGVVDIEDSDPNSFPDFLMYLYTASVDNLTSENALNLYTTADKYQVNELKNVCLHHMLNNISVENFCDLLRLSLLHNEKELIEVLSIFFLENSMAIALTPKWLVFMGENPVASNELYIKLMQHTLQ